MLFILYFLITVLGYLTAKLIYSYIPRIPIIVYSMFIILILLVISKVSYNDYIATVSPLFNRLLGYVTVALAIPLATIKYEDFPISKISTLVLCASTLAVGLPVGLAYLLHLSTPMIISFTTRAITTPIALNIADIIHAPPALVTLIVILSGVIGAAFSPLLLKNINDERAAGLALGLAAHAIGTAQAWQRSPVAGRYAAFGMAINGVFTAIWLPLTIKIFI
ncbi:LrgB family protein [Acinetobacter baumannii]|uniref:LrgB family protein n=1 Tax=Acinetobacter baumannii TaxID=470 RepID=UPI00244C181B|nr:LrgB family protein [Acinetobacter baumannii]MDH2626093.1 LrgB family protein [Acinetobacter baumannii]